MGFIGVYRAVYDYKPTGEGELAVTEGDLLFVLDKGDDDWWKAKKKAGNEEEDEPEGLVPANYVEEVGSRMRGDWVGASVTDDVWKTGTATSSSKGVV
jgi:hypothetical protein